MGGNEVWEQWGANTGDSQQLQSKPRLGVLHGLLRLLQSGPAFMGHWHRCRVGRAGGGMVSEAGDRCPDLGLMGNVSVRFVPSTQLRLLHRVTPWGPPD